MYYIETTRNGYTVYFGAPRVTEGSSVGRGVGETETVFISYVSSSGAGGNGTTNFTGLDGGVSITNSGTVSGGGYSSPNIDVVKFAAPRNFVGGGRLVSIADYEVGILNTGLVTTGSNPLNSISVYGSNSAAEQTPGKVLFSLFDTSLNSGAGDSLPGTSSVVSEIKTNFAEEVMLGTTFEYREPLEVDITFTSNSSVENFNSNYRRGFNQTFSSALNASLIKLETTKIPRSQEQTTGNFTGIASGGVIGLSGKFDFKNSIDFTSEGTTFAISFQENISIGGELRVATVSNNLITYSGGTLSSDNPSSGRFELDPNKFQVIRGITLNLTPGEIKVRDEILANPKITGS